MGLDMYLSAKKYVKDWKHNYPNEVIPENTVSRVTSRLLGIPDGSVTYVEAEAAYWRKANQIHNWFVANVQGGEDECKPHYVSRDDLKKLRQLCRKVELDNSLAKELLPTGEGFFFGSTDYDEWYFKDIRDTIEQIDKALETFDESWDFEYQSSW